MDRKLVYCALMLAVVICSFVPVSDAAIHWTYCGSKKSYSVLVKSVDVNPDPVVSGKPATFSISAISRNAISGGKLNLQVFFYGVPVHSESHDLCSKTSCPVKQGNFMLTNTQSLPGFTPPGSYRLSLKVLDADATLLTCIYINFRIVHSRMIAEN